MGLLNKTKKTKDEAVTAEIVEKKTKKVVAKKTANASVDTLHILKRPMLSEKTTGQESIGQYSFIVAKDTNKIEVKKAVEYVYGVRPTRVNMVNVEGKQTRSGRFAGRRSDYKKAIVFLPKGKRIDIHEGV
ncbi:50S ribosomal protein L23 [Patescibacteria group bacterium]|nr:50S ribosomal protein L23 [Patescibacteria group bacterium]MBU1721575.1 50S ribosomal protein L23 [Patescibacteria group bacterium]MBU1901801.1 50S ribosomal protein L23 [Patescibacteria group bacterium]